ncbi:MAG: gamma-glutamyl-gamma-aminobutyrate hydrolase family protein [Chloroflexota bacterium]
MFRPLIGITSFQLELPFLRSAVNQSYIDAILMAGGTPSCIPVGLDFESMQHVYSLMDGLLLPGGDDVAPERYGQDRHPSLGLVHHARDELELSLTQRALADGMPVLGICRGMQVIAVTAGGTLYQDLPSQLPTEVDHEVREFGRDHLAHTIWIEPGSRFAEAVSGTRLGVNSFHHQALVGAPPGFVVTARAPDGMIEAIEPSDDRYILGVQCHPEECWKTTSPESKGLFESFVRAAQEHKLPATSVAV